MCKKTYDMVALQPSKANAQHLTCFIAFIAASLLAIAMMVVACAFPAMITTVTETTCWISMGLEATSIGLGCVAFWIKRNAL